MEPEISQKNIFFESSEEVTVKGLERAAQLDHDFWKSWNGFLMQFISQMFPAFLKSKKY